MFATAVAVYAAGPDAAVLSQMRSAAPQFPSIQLLKRVPVTPELDLVVALANPDGYGSEKRDSGPWGDKSTLGLFLQRRDRPSTVYKVAVSEGHGECDARVERATATDVVLSCTPEKGGPEPNRKLVYDIGAKALVKQFDYQPFALKQIFVSGDDTVLVGSDGQRVVAVNCNSADEPSFRILKGVEAGRWAKRYSPEKPFQPVSFGPNNRFSVEIKGVFEHIGKTVKRHWLPQTTYNEYARARPSRVKDGYTRQGTTIDEEIGPRQVVDGTLWFAKTFPDEEGYTGVGGFGYFDTDSRTYRIYSPPEIVDWAASAMLVDSGTVWLALAYHGEWRDGSGGILRIDQTTQQVENIPLRDIASAIVRTGDRLLLATDFGAALVEDRKVRRFFVDQATDGRLRVAEAVLGN